MVVVVLFAWFYGLIIFVTNTCFPVFSIFLLRRFMKNISQFEEEVKAPLPHYPGITILTSIRGTSISLEEGLSSLMKQDYPGPLELIIAIESSQDPGYDMAKKVLERIPHRMEIKWITDFKPEGGNPRTAKLAYAAKYAKFDWIYWLAVDTYTEGDHLRKMMHKAKANPDIYVSALPVHTGGKSLVALLENVPLAWELPMLGLLTRNMKRPFVYGGSVLFNMNLLNRAGGFGPLVNYLTEEVPMTVNFSRAGGQAELVPSLIWVRSDTQSIAAFYSRMVRWAIAGKHHHKRLLCAAFIFSLLWLLIFFLITGSPWFLYFLGGAFVVKVLVVYLYHRILDLPRWQAKWSVLMIPYDFICFSFCLAALFINRVNWAGDVMRVDSKGILTRE